MMPPIILLGTERDPRAIPLATRDGVYLPNYRTQELAPETHRAAAEMFQKTRPGARLRSSTSQYNCVGLVFASRRTWVESDHLQLILKSDGYKKVENEQNLMVGDLVVYENEQHDLTHVGLVVEIKWNLVGGKNTILILSKWGQNGEYLHEIEDVPPLLGRPSTFWTERREVL